MKRLFAQAYGRVQGVGFRYFVQSAAKKYGLSGWVKNMSDGSVTMEVQGDAPKLDSLFAEIKKGNVFIKVARIDTKSINIVDGDNGFDIKY
ncbi:acylphosphatase [Pectinatus cerevisiiphilus]|uniref:acylphosphatase n=1 Tax=Pectinatus cerevisiiphilus TaxID=86956 RepID=A0A4V2US18_9FIRM|nr:acylphosphatase [Pectinatus cerevisiiphilus]TCS79692.1 acylphosphatase [Pectinatus cerevisiiphilus]